MADTQQQLTLCIKHAADIGRQLVDVVGQVTKLILADAGDAVVKVPSTNPGCTRPDGFDGSEQEPHKNIGKSEQ